MILLYNGIIDSVETNTTALAVNDGRIMAIGSDAEILNLENPGCEKIDLRGKTVWPGLIDSHIHLEMFSQSLLQVKCETDTIDQCLRLVSDKSRVTPADEWITGQGWNQNTWGSFGSATQLDSVTGDHPTFLADKSIHAAWVNSKALSIAGIDRHTQDPPGGTILRNSNGEPTGILLENAVSLVEKCIPAPTHEKKLSAMRLGQEELHRLGLTGVHDFDGPSCFTTLQKLHQADELTLRVTKGIPVELLDDVIKLGVVTGFGDDQLHIGSIKMFADGALGPQTAAMFKPYENTSDNFGTLLLTDNEVFETGMKATSHGLSLAIHAIGDKGTNQVLNGLAMVRQFELANGLTQKLHRVEHLQLLHPDDVQKTKDLGVIASMQPIHLASDMFTADKHWGKRSRLAYAFASLINSGTRVIFGSDAPVESPNPFLGIHAAVTRRRVNGDPGINGWYPTEKISLRQAKKSYSEFPAYVAGCGDRYGQLKPGMYADLIILSKDPKSIELDEISQLLPEQVMVAGKWVYTKN